MIFVQGLPGSTVVRLTGSVALIVMDHLPNVNTGIPPAQERANNNMPSIIMRLLCQTGDIRRIATITGRMQRRMQRRGR